MARPKCDTPLVVYHWRWYWIIESFQIGCCSAAWLSCITELAQQTTTHLTNTACSIFYYFFANRHSWSAELLGEDLMPWPKGTERADWKFTFDDKFVLLHIFKARYWMSQRVRNQQTHFWLALYNKSWNPMEAKRVNCL